MGVPARHSTISQLLGTFLVLFAWASLAGMAQAGGECCNTCCKHKKNHVVRVPGVSVTGPNVHVSTPGVFVNKGGVSVHNSFSSNGGFFIGGGGSIGQTIFSGGGGGGFIGGGSTASVIADLNVEAEAVAEAVTEQVAVPYTETITKNRWIEDVFVLRAVCIDDKGVPHPSSRPDPNDQVDPNYVGELFRCMAGTSMQVTLGKYADGQSRYDNASTMVCAKGEALRHNIGGELLCAPQEPRRNCNERSLLRKFGPGIKVVRLRRMEQYSEQVTRTRYETRTVSASASASAKARVSTRLILSGGVGN